MAIVSSCPECAKPVSLPTAAPEAHVRCPNCSAEYELRRALELAPPMLELVVSPPPFGNGFAVAPALSAAAVEHRDIAGSFDEALELGEPPITDSDGNDEPDTEVEGSVPLIDELLAQPTEPVEAPDFSAAPLDTDRVDIDQLDFGAPHDSEAPLTGSAEEDEIGVEEPEDTPVSEFPAGEPGVSVVSSALNRRKREPSFIGNLIGVVGGGVVGCSLAYFIVLWIGGPPKDFLELGPKLPKWMLPASFSVPATAEAAPTANPAPSTPMGTTPTPGEVNEMKEAAQRDDEPMLKLNVPALPDKPAAGGGQGDAVKLPFDTEPPSTPDDLASELHEDEILGGAAIEPPDVVKKAAAREAITAEPQPTTFFQNPVSYRAADLETVLADVKQLASQVNEGQPTRKQLMSYYLKLYRLGEVATFATDADAARQQVNVLLANLAADATKLPEIGRNGAGFFGLTPEKQGENKGVLLAGDVEASEAVGTLHRIMLLPTGGKKAISVYSATDPGFRPGSTVLVLGGIVNDPQAALKDFAGDEAKIVWLGASMLAKP